MVTLIGKYLAGECSPAETRALEDWLSAKEENRLYFQSMQGVWELAGNGQNHVSAGIDVENALRKTKKRLKTGAQQPLGLRVGFVWLARAAAALLLLATAYWFLRPEHVLKENYAAAALPRIDTLRDGSVIGLNKGSVVSAEISAKTRKVRLQGEAYFEIAHDAGKPFTVEVNQLKVEVIGTKFNVDNRTDADKIVVEVTEGKVKVASAEQAVFLTAGEKAVFHLIDGQFEKLQVENNPNVRAWLDRKFVFDETPLAEVIPLLEKAYGVNIILKNKALADCPVYVAFDQLPIEKILEILCETLSLNHQKLDNAFILDGKTCAE